MVARRTGWAPVVAALLGATAGCGGQSTTASPGPRVAGDRIAVLDAPFGSDPNGVMLVRSDGTGAAHLSLPADAEAIALAGNRLLVGGGGRLESIESSGRATSLGDLAGDTPDELVRGLVASPDGHSWMWASVRQQGDGTVVSTVWLAGDHRAPVSLLTRTETGSALQPVAWTAAGPVLGDEPIGIGGYILFRRSFGPTLRLDVQTGLLTSLAGADCAFSDLSAQATLACVKDGREGPHGDGAVTLRLLPRSGPEINVPLPRSINQAGAALFRGDGATLTLALSPALGESGDEVECDLVDARTGQRHTLGPDGITPVSWLPDGRLLAVRRPGVAGGEVGTYLVAPDGSALRVAQSAEAIGLLHG